MPRIMIGLPGEILDRISRASIAERRTPREQIEYDLIEKYGRPDARASRKEASHVN